MNYYDLLTSKDSRGCYMDKEYNLTHYRVYNKENCQRECVAEFIMNKCECALLSASSKIESV